MSLEKGNQENQEKWSERFTNELEMLKATIKDEAARSEHFTPAIRAHILTALDVTPQQAISESFDRSRRFRERGRISPEEQAHYFLNDRIKSSLADVISNKNTPEEAAALNELFHKIVAE